MMAFRRLVFALTNQIKAQARIITRTKAKEWTKKRKSKERAYLQSGLSASETPNEEGKNTTTGLPAIGLTSPGRQLLRGFARMLILHGR